MYECKNMPKRDIWRKPIDTLCAQFIQPVRKSGVPAVSKVGVSVSAHLCEMLSWSAGSKSEGTWLV